MLNKVMIKFKEEQLGYEEKMDLLTEGICKGICPYKYNKESGGDYRVFITPPDIKGFQTAVCLEQIKY